jgi:hypothetical protein
VTFHSHIDNVGEPHVCLVTISRVSSSWSPAMGLCRDLFPGWLLQVCFKSRAHRLTWRVTNACVKESSRNCMVHILHNHFQRLNCFWKLAQIGGRETSYRRFTLWLQWKRHIPVAALSSPAALSATKTHRREGEKIGSASSEFRKKKSRKSTLLLDSITFSCANLMAFSCKQLLMQAEES